MMIEKYLIRTLCLSFFLLSSTLLKAEKEDSIISATPIHTTTIVFDSIKTADMLPLFKTKSLSYHPSKMSIFSETPFSKKLKNREDSMRLHNRMVYEISLNHSELIDFYNLKQYDSELDKTTVKEHEIRISGLEPVNNIPDFADIKKHLRQKPKSPWKFYGNLAIQFSQYYVTDNWHKGGSPNATFLTIFDYNIDFHKEKLLWENDFDVKIGFYNTSEDTIRAFRVNNDLVRISSLLAYQTWFSKKIYYSAAVDFNTSLFTGYKTTNSNVVVTGFLSPSRVFFSLGMECRYNNKTTIRLAPFAYKLLFLTDERIDPLAVGIDSTSKHTNYPGYLVQAKLDWHFSKEINLTSKIDFFSSYDSRNIEFDWEVIGKFIINRYLSTRLSFIMRFDNTPKNEDAEIQIQEQLSFGFNYVFR